MKPFCHYDFRREREIESQTLDFFLKTLSNVATRCRARSAQSNLDWLLELMGLIRSQLRQEVPTKSSQSKVPAKKSSIVDKSSEGFLFLFDVFNLAIIVFSESETLVANVERDLCSYDNSRSKRLALLPLATARLLDHEQVLFTIFQDLQFQILTKKSVLVCHGLISYPRFGCSFLRKSDVFMLNFTYEQSTTKLT